MQFCQPGYVNNSKSPSFYNTPFQFNGFPNIIGEGNVVSLTCPDGNVQFIFLPSAQWWRALPCNPSFGNTNCCNNVDAWIVRSICNPLQLPITCSTFPQLCGFHYPQPCSSNPCLEQPQNITLKFHHDCCTSTSDIHYFFPKLRCSDWFQNPKTFASVEVNTAMNTECCQPPIIHTDCCPPPVIYTDCCKPPALYTRNHQHCCINLPEEVSKKNKEECICICPLTTCGSKISCCHRKERCSHRHISKKEVTCECNTSNSEKCTTTYAEQGSNCCEENVTAVECINASNQSCHKSKSQEFTRNNKNDVNYECKDEKNCECKPLRDEKCITTYAEQVSNSCEKKGTITQTGNSTIVDKRKKCTKRETCVPIKRRSSVSFETMSTDGTDSTRSSASCICTDYCLCCLKKTK